MFATRRTHVIRATLSIAALSAGLLASNAHAGLLGGGAGGGLTGALSPRSLNIGGNAAGNATASPDGSLIKNTVDQTKTQVGDVKQGVTDKVGKSVAAWKCCNRPRQ